LATDGLILRRPWMVESSAGREQCRPKACAFEWEVNLVKNPIYVIGHRNPDTDSICSAIAYAHMKEALGEKVVAARAGKINVETKYVLEYLKVEAPVLINDLYPRVKQVMLEELVTAHPWHTVRELGEIMKSSVFKSIPVVDADNILRGVVTVGDLAKRYFDELEMADISDSGVDFTGLLRVLDGVLEVGGDLSRKVPGAVRIAAAQPRTVARLLNPGDIVLIGDREEAQLVCLRRKISCLIVTSDAEVSEVVKQEALLQGTIVIRAPYDTYTCARLINLSIPVQSIMHKDVTTFKPEELLEDVKPVIVNTNFRSYPVVENDKLVGLVQRGQLIVPTREKVILVDHNERSQAVEGIEGADIVEIIDHHRLGGLETGEPIFIRHEPVGCTATIIANMYWHRGIDIPKTIAGLLLSAILSDTVLFKSPTCTSKDKTTATRLAEIAGIDIQSYGADMLKAGASIAGMTANDILRTDLKEFQMGEFRVVIGQISVMEPQEVLRLKPVLIEEMQAIKVKEKFDMVVLLITDILREDSYVLFVGEPHQLLEQAFHIKVKDHEAFLAGVLSRKKQVVPPMVNTAKTWGK
jgi:manganese-dependent inorganic pyrophosphatase